MQNYVVDSYHLKSCFIDIRKVTKIYSDQKSSYGYGLSRESLERAAVCMFQYVVMYQGKISYS